MVLYRDSGSVRYSYVESLSVLGFRSKLIRVRREYPGMLVHPQNLLNTLSRYEVMIELVKNVS